MNRSEFVDTVMQIVGGARQHMENPSMSSVFMAYFLQEQNQSRVFKVSVDEVVARETPPSPDSGYFVAFAEGRDTEEGRLIMAFCHFPPGSKQSVNVHMLAYGKHEYQKASEQMVLWIEKQIASIADGE